MAIVSWLRRVLSQLAESMDVAENRKVGLALFINFSLSSGGPGLCHILWLSELRRAPPTPISNFAYVMSVR